MICNLNYHIASKFGERLGSAAETLAKFQSDWIILSTNFAVSGEPTKIVANLITFEMKWADVMR